MKTTLKIFKNKLAIPVLLILVSFCVAAKNKTPVTSALEQTTEQKICFTENKGQVHDQNFRTNSNVLFGGNDGNLVYHLKNNGVSYQLNRVDSWKETELQKKGLAQAGKTQKIADQITIYRLDIRWLNMNPNAAIIKGNTLEGFSNYYSRSCPKGALKVKSYEEVTYQNIYPGIDLKWYQKEGHLKYDFVVGKNVDYKQIQIDIQGANKIAINTQGELIMQTPIGDIIEQAPFVTQNGRTLKSNWLIKNNQVTFEIENSDPSQPLLIDPALRAWATYYGGSGIDNANFCTTDASNNVYMAGVTTTSGGTVIATTGSHQSTHGIGNNAFLAKFNAAGVRQWATYYGDVQEAGNSCAADASGNVYMAGQTATSASGVIATPGSHQPVYGGGNSDSYLVKFDASGTRLWATYYGGTGGIDVGNSCATDPSGNVYLAGNTTTHSGTVIATPGSHQPAFGSNVDAYLVKFNTNGIRQWATYYGGSGLEYGLCAATDVSGNVFLTGQTSTPNGTGVATIGSHQQAEGVGSSFDAYLVKFDGNGIRQWGTYYGGAGDDEGNSCSADLLGNIFMAGDTRSGTLSDTIATAVSQQPLYGNGYEDAFLVKFNAGGVRQWGTYYGGSGDDSGASCSTSASGNVYLAGTTSSTLNSAIATPGSYQFIPAGCYLAAFNSSGVRQWGTFYGGAPINVSYGLSCAADHAGSVYLAGFSNASLDSTIATPGSHQYVIGGSSDAYLVKFKDCSVTGAPSAISGLTLTCKGTVHYSVSPASGAQSYIWNLPSGWVGSSTTNTISAVTGGNGLLSVSASGSCGVSPAQTLSVTVKTCTGINELVNTDTQLRLFPNPNNGQFELIINGTVNKYATLKMYDLFGKLVYETELINDELSKKINADVISDGVYFLKVNSDQKEYVLKVIINK